MHEETLPANSDTGFFCDHPAQHRWDLVQSVDDMFEGDLTAVTEDAERTLG